MNATFNIQQICEIATNVRRYKMLYVTSEGVMFRTKSAVENAVRVRNMIIDDPAKLVGYIEITENNVTNDNLKQFAKNTGVFAALFKDAVIPKMRTTLQPKEREYKADGPVDAAIVDDVKKSLGLVKEAPEVLDATSVIEEHGNEKTK